MKIKTTVQIFFVFTTCFLLAAFSVARAEHVDRFDAKIDIQESGRVNIAENIIYDFGSEQRHGIFRTIPVKYQRKGAEFNLRIENVQVTNGQGVPVPFNLSFPGQNIEIKIGSADAFVSGVQTYVIHYTVNRAVNFFADHDEVYWNVTGDLWPGPIIETGAQVKFEGGENIFAECFVGSLGSSERCEVSVEDSLANFASGRELQPGEQLTIVYGFPKGLVKEPSQIDKIKYFLFDNWILAIPLLVLMAMYLVWRKYGRDPKGRAVIVAEYEPPANLSPLEIGIVIDERAGKGDITAEIIYLAVLGFIKITREEKKKLGLFSGSDYRLDLLKPLDTAPTEFDRKLLELLFESDKKSLVQNIKKAIGNNADAEEKDILELGAMDSVYLSHLKNNTKFAKALEEVKSEAYSSLVLRRYFAKNPNTVKALWMLAAVAGGFGIGLVASLAAPQNPLSFLVGILSGMIILVFGLFMSKLTKAGVAARKAALGLKEYIKIAEKDRLAFHNAPEKTFERFERLLPFAMALGVDKQWVKQFEGLHATNPAWYSDPSGAAFNFAVLSSSVRDFSSSLSGAVASSAGSGGSGFSGGGAGGGFGGGGGGGW